MTSRLRRSASVVLAVVVGAAAVAPAAMAAPPPRPDVGQVHYAVYEPVCAVAKDADVNRCFAVERVEVAEGTRGAFTYTAPNGIGLGPAGGYTPDDIAKAYGIDPATNSSKQTVGVVDWNDDPNALADLDHFDSYYGLPAETSTSFRKVNQKGRAAPLPKASTSAADEIALDVESVRGMCHTCRILLVEATTSGDTNLAAAENTAAGLGATEIDNGFGRAEHPVSAGVRAAYNHPGVVITAPTGDDGWYGWDRVNDVSGASADAPQYPSTDPHVVAVGGTALELNTDATRYDEQVWNENGPDDGTGWMRGHHQGAGGGGCSRLYAAPAWQSADPGYRAAGCDGRRLAADVSADADLESGLDVYRSYGGNGWVTMGGTSLASSLIAAMFALAGGSHGAAYPASTLYTDAGVRSSSLYDVTAGGTGFCGGDSTLTCGDTASQDSNGRTHNPNQLVKDNLLDCSFPATGDVVTPPAISSQCNATTGYDGPSGLGTPTDLGLFARTNPSVTVTHTTLFRLRKSLTFTATVKEVLAGTQPVSFVWDWGDGHTTTTTSATTHHTYTAAGVHIVTLTETDNRHAMVIRKLSTSVGRTPSVRVLVPSSAKAHKAIRVSAAGSAARNTGAKISRITWHFGDGHAATGTAPKHTYARKGTFTATVTVADSSGVSTTVRRSVKVTG